MKIKALVGFSGILSMAEGEELEYDNKEVIEDLKQAGYIEIVEKADSKIPQKKEEKKNEGKRNK